MKKLYAAPEFVTYGGLVDITGVRGAPADKDISVDRDGDTTATGTLSTDECAQDGFKCKCLEPDADPGC